MRTYIHVFVFIHTHTHTQIYIYIYIYSHPQTDCFVVSQLFSVARHVGRLKLRSKPAYLYVRHSIRPLGQQAYQVSLGNYKVLCSNSSSGVRLFTFYNLSDTRVLNSFEELCIMRAAAENSFARVLNLSIYLYIYLYMIELKSLFDFLHIRMTTRLEGKTQNSKHEVWYLGESLTHR